MGALVLEAQQKDKLCCRREDDIFNLYEYLSPHL